VLYIVGGFGSPVAGNVADRVGGRAMLLALFAAGSVGTVGVAVARCFSCLPGSAVDGPGAPARTAPMLASTRQAPG
jgi:MFS family permease